jgi:predicted 2-oxoglutarate/Fe(II)-dependent dioxygenase YbiX
MGPQKGTRIMVNSASAGNRRYLPSSPFKPPPEPPPVEQYALHDLVTHDKYGLGRVILVEGDTAVVVDFAPRRVRIMAPFTRMTRL